MKTLYLVRHGETWFNKMRKIQGWCDSPLTERGKQQAQAAHLYFEENGITFDHAYSSTQERACDTLEIITTMPYKRLKGVKEMHFGTYEGADSALMPHGFQWLENYYVQFGGESSFDVAHRVYDTLTEVMEKSDHETVLVVSHGGAIACFLNAVSGSETEPLLLPNCGILKFGYDGEFHFEELVDPVQNIRQNDEMSV